MATQQDDALIVDNNPRDPQDPTDDSSPDSSEMADSKAAKHHQHRQRSSEIPRNTELPKRTLPQGPSFADPSAAPKRIDLRRVTPPTRNRDRDIVSAKDFSR